MNSLNERVVQKIVHAVLCGTILLGVALDGVTQCVPHPKGETTVVLMNETKYELMFQIDDSYKGTVPSKQSSREWNVSAGEHLLKAGAVIDGLQFWVWAENEVPEGHLCTWTVYDPAKEISGRAN